MTRPRQTAETQADERGGGARKRPAAARSRQPAPRKRSVASPSTGGGRRRRQPPEIAVDPDLCKSCGICIKLCPRGVLSADAEGRPVLIDPEACTRCRFCEQHCPDFALQLVDTEKPPADEENH